MTNVVTPEISCNQVREVITSIKNSSPGSNELSPYVAKSCIEGLIQPIAYLVNESLKIWITSI